MTQLFIIDCLLVANQQADRWTRLAKADTYGDAWAEGGSQRGRGPR